MKYFAFFNKNNFYYKSIIKSSSYSYNNVRKHYNKNAIS